MSWTILGNEAVINSMVSEKGVKRPSGPNPLTLRQEPESSGGKVSLSVPCYVVATSGLGVFLVLHLEDLRLCFFPLGFMVVRREGG